MKIYENIGFVYQKKILGSNRFSIKFIIKFPREVAKNNKFQE
jgi:hypothetical protein